MTVAPPRPDRPGPIEALNLKANPNYPRTSPSSLILRYPIRQTELPRLMPPEARKWETKVVMDQDEAEIFLLDAGDMGIIRGIKTVNVARWFTARMYARTHWLGQTTRYALRYLVKVAGEVPISALNHDHLTQAYRLMIGTVVRRKVIATEDGEKTVEIKMSAKTVQSYLWRMKAMVNKAVEIGALDHDPVRDRLQLFAPDADRDSSASAEDKDLAELRHEATALEGGALAMAAELSAGARQMLAACWNHVDVFGRSMLLARAPQTDDTQTHYNRVMLTESALLALIRLRLLRLREGRADEERLFPDWTHLATVYDMFEGLQDHCGRTLSIKGKTFIGAEDRMDLKMIRRAPGLRAARADGRITAMGKALQLGPHATEHHLGTDRRPPAGHKKVGDFPAWGDGVWFEALP